MQSNNTDRNGVRHGACRQVVASTGRPCRCQGFYWTPGNADLRCEDCGHFPYDHEEQGDDPAGDAPAPRAGPRTAPGAQPTMLLDARRNQPQGLPRATSSNNRPATPSRMGDDDGRAMQQQLPSRAPAADDDDMDDICQRTGMLGNRNAPPPPPPQQSRYYHRGQPQQHDYGYDQGWQQPQYRPQQPPGPYQQQQRQQYDDPNQQYGGSGQWGGNNNAYSAAQHQPQWRDPRMMPLPPLGAAYDQQYQQMYQQQQQPMMQYPQQPPYRGQDSSPAPAPAAPGSNKADAGQVAKQKGDADKAALAQQIKKCSTRAVKKGKKTKYDIYQPRMTSAYEHEFQLAPGVKEGRKGGIRKLTVGTESNLSVKDIVILIVGATGCGKTTFLNGLANYLFGVQHSDDFRFKIVTPEDESEEGESDCKSKTRWVSAYVFQDTIHKSFRLTVVDTPGFGDTGGMERDKETTKFIGEWFKKTGESGLDHLNGICFVVKNSETRLTPQTVYQIGSVTRLFGKDMKDNMVPIITFCDGGKPPALQALMDQKIEFKKHFAFNNSGIFPVDEDDNFEDLFWQLGMKSYEAFCNYLFTVQATSLNLSKEVLRRREELECHVMDMKKKLDEEMMCLEEMKQHVAIIRRFEAEIETNKNYQVTVSVPKVIKQDVPNNQYTTICVICSYTCHATCGIPDDDQKAGCIAMDSNGQCKNCPKRCHWREHKNLRFIFVTEQVQETTTLDELRDKYNTASSGMVSAQDLLRNLANKFMASQQHMHDLIVQIRDAINELKKIAMSDDKMTEVDYINLLIQSENEQKRPGYAERVEHLQAQLKMAELIARVNDPNFDPFASYRADPSGWMKYLLDTFPQMRTLIDDLGGQQPKPQKKPGFLSRIF